MNFPPKLIPYQIKTRYLVTGRQTRKVQKKQETKVDHFLQWQ